MKSPQEWLDLFTAQDTTYDRPTAEANIKAVQDEAFKAGVQESCEQLLKAMENLETDPDPFARDIADPALKATLEDKVRRRLEGI